MSPTARWWRNVFEITQSNPFFPVVKQWFHIEVDVLTVEHQWSKVYSGTDKPM